MVQPAESQDAVDAVAKGLVAPRNHAKARLNTVGPDRNKLLRVKTLEVCVVEEVQVHAALLDELERNALVRLEKARWIPDNLLVVVPQLLRCRALPLIERQR